MGRGLSVCQMRVGGERRCGKGRGRGEERRGGNEREEEKRELEEREQKKKHPLSLTGLVWAEPFDG